MSDTAKPRREWRLLEERGDKTFIGLPLTDDNEAAQEPVVPAAAYDELQRERDATAGLREAWESAHQEIAQELHKAEVERDEAVKLLREVVAFIGWNSAERNMQDEINAFLSRRVVAPEDP